MLWTGATRYPGEDIVVHGRDDGGNDQHGQHGGEADADYPTLGVHCSEVTSRLRGTWARRTCEIFGDNDGGMGTSVRYHSLRRTACSCRRREEPAKSKPSCCGCGGKEKCQRRQLEGAKNERSHRRMQRVVRNRILVELLGVHVISACVPQRQ